MEVIAKRSTFIQRGEHQRSDFSESNAYACGGGGYALAAWDVCAALPLLRPIEHNINGLLRFASALYHPRRIFNDTRNVPNDRGDGKKPGVSSLHGCRTFSDAVFGRIGCKNHSLYHRKYLIQRSNCGANRLPILSHGVLWSAS